MPNDPRTICQMSWERMEWTQQELVQEFLAPSTWNALFSMTLSGTQHSERKWPGEPAALADLVSPSLLCCALKMNSQSSLREVLLDLPVGTLRIAQERSPEAESSQCTWAAALIQVSFNYSSWQSDKHNLSRSCRGNPPHPHECVILSVCLCDCMYEWLSKNVCECLWVYVCLCQYVSVCMNAGIAL